jgi:hypothetical protein
LSSARAESNAWAFRRFVGVITICVMLSYETIT